MMHCCSKPVSSLALTALSSLFSNSVQIHEISTLSHLDLEAANAMIFLFIIAKLSSLWIICAFVWSNMVTNLSIVWVPIQLRLLASQSTNMSCLLTQHCPAQSPPPWNLPILYQLCFLAFWIGLTGPLSSRLHRLGHTIYHPAASGCC